MSEGFDKLEQERFDQWAETYEHSYMQWLLFDRVHRRMLGQVPAGFVPTRVLDIGCGTGRLLRRMHETWPSASFIGIDLSQGMVAKAHEFSSFATFYQAPAEYLPLENDLVDLVTSSVSFHHWSDQEKGICEISRVLRRGGYLILADPNVGHGHPLSRGQLRDLFQSADIPVRRQASVLPFFSVTVGVKS